MKKYETKGLEIREMAKAHVLDFLRSTDIYGPGGEGIRLSQIFKQCGFDWGDYKKATSSNQQYWVLGLVRELESEGKVEQVTESGPWRLR